MAHLQTGRKCSLTRKLLGLRYICKKQKIPSSRPISQSRFLRTVKLTKIKDGPHIGKFKVEHVYSYSALEIGAWKTYMIAKYTCLALSYGK